MLNAVDIKSIYTNQANQASQERQQRANNVAADIIGSVAAAAARGQRAHFVKCCDIPADIVHAVKDTLINAGFTVKTRSLNGYQKIEISF